MKLKDMFISEAFDDIEPGLDRDAEERDWNEWFARMYRMIDDGHYNIPPETMASPEFLAAAKEAFEQYTDMDTFLNRFDSDMQNSPFAKYFNESVEENEEEVEVEEDEEGFGDDEDEEGFGGEEDGPAPKKLEDPTSSRDEFHGGPADPEVGFGAPTIGHEFGEVPEPSVDPEDKLWHDNGTSDGFGEEEEFGFGGHEKQTGEPGPEHNINVRFADHESTRSSKKEVKMRQKRSDAGSEWAAYHRSQGGDTPERKPERVKPREHEAEFDWDHSSGKMVRTK
jgi:hypothetical protein